MQRKSNFLQVLILIVLAVCAILLYENLQQRSLVISSATPTLVSVPVPAPQIATPMIPISPTQQFDGGATSQPYATWTPFYVMPTNPPVEYVTSTPIPILIATQLPAIVVQTQTSNCQQTKMGLICGESGKNP